MFKSIFILLVAVVLSLHSNHYYSSNHNHNHLNDDKELQIQNGLKQIQSQLQSITTQYNQLSVIPSTQPVSSGSTQQSTSNNGVKLPFIIGQKCRSLTNDQQSNLNSLVNTQNSELDNVKQEVKQCMDCAGILQIQKQIQKLDNHIKFMQNDIKNGCQLPQPLPAQNLLGLTNLKQSLFKDNAKADNWSYGTLTPEQYNLRAFSASAQYDLTSCPIQNPFSSLDRKSCLSCTDHQYFNKQTRQCESCQPQQLFNLTNKNCEAVTCNQNQFFNTDTKKCQKCPDETPLYNSIIHKCDKCSNPQIYDFNQQKCIEVTCPTNQLYNGKKSQCQACPPQIPVLNPDTKICQSCQQGAMFNVTDMVCQPCTVPTPYWNKVSKKCEQCPINSIWDKNQKICGFIQCPDDYPNYNNDTKKCQGCNSSYVYDKGLKMCRIRNTSGLCDPKTPIYDPLSLSCKACPQNSTYNKQAGICEVSCPRGQQYDNIIKKCLNICKDSLIYNQGTCKTPEEIKGCDNPDQLFSKVKNTCVNISETCNNDTQYYNAVTKECQIIPICPSGNYYNKITNKCQNVNYITSPKTPNLIYNNKPFSEYQAYYNSFINVNPNFKDCPESNPYYSLTLNNCVSCPSTHPYFNLNSYKCQNCGKFDYNNDTKSCNSETPNVSPSLQRLIMNII